MSILEAVMLIFYSSTTKCQTHCKCFQAEYEVTPDEKRKECGQELIDKYFNPKVCPSAFDSLNQNLTFVMV